MTTYNATPGQPISGVTLSGGDFGFVSSGGTASDVLLKDGSALTVFSGGVASFTTLSGGFDYISSGGSAVGTVLSGGTEAIYGGGTASFSVVSANGGQVVYSGGKAIGTELSGGLEAVYSGGSANGTFVGAGGGQYVYTGGTATGTVVNSGGAATLFAGGSASLAVVTSDGALTIEANASATLTTISNGGTEILAAGGFAMQTTVDGGGVLIVDSGGSATFTTVSQGGEIDLPSLTYSSGSAVIGGGGDTLTVTEGATSATLQLAGIYTGEHFQTAQDSGTGTLLTLVEPARTLDWTGASSTDFASAANWDDLTNSVNPAVNPPYSTDTAAFLTLGGTITGSGTAASLQIGGTASWEVTSGASLSAASGVTVGQGGTGSLLVNGGASISGLGTLDGITGASGSAASVTVDGSGSTWKSAGELVIGNTGAGAATVSNAASLSATAGGALPALALGLSAGGTGALTVTGAGSSATLTGQLNVGQAGAGTLTVANQATLRTGNDAALDPSEGFDIAQLAGGSGAATVSGSKSLLANIGRFVVGDAGLGSLAIVAGATVTTSPGTGAGAIVANGTGANGSSVNVSGAGSNWQVGGLLDLGVAGSGALSLSGGATVTAGSLDAANAASAVARISVSGAGSELLVTNAATVADDGTGVLSVLDGATVSAASLTIGSQTDSSGALVVSGNGSKLSISGQLNIGTALGTGDLTVGPGAVVNASVVNLQGGVVLEGGVLDPTVYIENGGSTTGGFGTIASDFILLEGTILSNGSKSGKQTEVVEGTLVGGGTADIKGSVSVNGPGILQIGTHDTIELTGAVLNAATTTFTDNLTPTGTYTVNNSVIDVVFQDSTGVLVLDDIAGFAGTVATWTAGDSFVITGGTLSNIAVGNGNTLSFSDAGTGAGAGGIDQIIFGSGISAGAFGIVNGDTVQAVACFAEGTRIGTVDGWVAVEDLRVGDRVITLEAPRGAASTGADLSAAAAAGDWADEAIVWIGQRAVHCAAQPRPEAVWPVRVRAGAFGEHGPVRDLYLSPDHAVFVNGVLVPVRLLIDGDSIVQVKRDRVRYFHVELPGHAVILAEGLTVESYLDSGDRADFQDGDGAIRLFPAFGAGRETATAWETRGAALLVLAGDKLEAARRAVREGTARGEAHAHSNTAYPIRV